MRSPYKIIPLQVGCEVVSRATGATVGRVVRNENEPDRSPIAWVAFRAGSDKPINDGERTRSEAAYQLWHHWRGGR